MPFHQGLQPFQPMVYLKKDELQKYDLFFL